MRAFFFIDINKLANHSITTYHPEFRLQCFTNPPIKWQLRELQITRLTLH